ncbi:MAG: hypothetical protein ACC707_01215 [Thiohalomonadales bacterium]
MSKITDFDQNETQLIEQTLLERYGKPVEIHLADTELRLYPDDRELTECPAVYWEQDDCHFVVSKIGKEKFYCQFYYKGSEQFGTSIREYDDLLNCIVTLLRLQADHQLGDTPPSA